MRKYLRSVARYAMAMMGFHHVNKALSANWRNVLITKRQRDRRAIVASVKRWRRLVRRYRIEQGLRKIFAPLIHLWDAVRGLYWRAIQPV